MSLRAFRSSFHAISVTLAATGKVPQKKNTLPKVLTRILSSSQGPDLDASTLHI